MSIMLLHELYLVLKVVTSKYSSAIYYNQAYIIMHVCLVLCIQYIKTLPELSIYTVCVYYMQSI